MSKEEDNKIIVGRWFTDFWGKTCNLDIVDELAAPDMLLQYSLHEPRRGREDIKAFMSSFREAFPDLNFWGIADLIAEGDYVVGRWEGGGTHTGPAFSDFLIGSLPAATGRTMRFTGTTVLRIENNKIVEEIGLDDGVTALQMHGREVQVGKHFAIPGAGAGVEQASTGGHGEAAHSSSQETLVKIFAKRDITSCAFRDFGIGSVRTEITKVYRKIDVPSP